MSGNQEKQKIEQKEQEIKQKEQEIKDAKQEIKDAKQEIKQKEQKIEQKEQEIKELRQRNASQEEIAETMKSLTALQNSLPILQNSLQKLEESLRMLEQEKMILLTSLKSHVTIPNLIEFGKSFENKAFKDGGTRDEWFEKVDDLARLDVPLFGRKSDVKQIFGFIEMLLKEGKSDRGTQTSLVLTGGPGVGSHHLNFLIEIINTQTTTKKKFSSSLPYRQDSFLCGTEEGAYFVFERHQPARFSQTL